MQTQRVSHPFRQKADQNSLHSSLEQHIQTIRPLHELERNADKEQFLELIDHKSALTKLNDEQGDETAVGDGQIE
jgi:hypothetical protein